MTQSCDTGSGPKIDAVNPVDEDLHPYNDVLTELVTHHFYRLYLGDYDVDKIDKK
ncbi:MAG TPA: hypothetical protein VK589_14235 [Chryseolinea sp.]|nr:hypothetical protein [Chryseolinea sp.]